MKDKTKSKKKKWIIIGSIVLVIVLLVVGVKACTNNLTKAVTEMVTNNQAEVTERNLIKSVGATGTITAVNKKDITVNLQGVEVSSVNVEVGDTVSEGDLLLTFDTTDIEENLSDAEAALSDAEKQSSISLSNAKRNYSDTERAASYSIDSAKTQMDQAGTSYNDAVTDLDSAKNQLAYYEKQRDAYKKNIENTQSSIATKTAEQNTAYTALSSAQITAAGKQALYEDALTNAGKTQDQITAGEAEGWETEGGTIKAAYGDYLAAQTALTTAQTNYTNVSNEISALNVNLASYQQDYQTYVSNVATWDAKVTSLTDQVDSLKSTYESTVKSYDNTVANQNSSLASAKNSLDSTKISQSTATDTQEKQVETYEKQYENGTVYAPISGVVTAVNYEVGDTYSGGTLITIQDTSDFIVETQISEYDISDIEKGQQVLIKTDATGDEELEGTVIFVSPTATQSVATSTTANYLVKISVDTKNERLRLDMTASLSIILSEHENAMTVPYNAVGTDEEGNTFVTRMNGEEVENIYVTVVMESNYYTEIESDELKVGDTVLIIEQEESNSLYDMMYGGDEEGGF